MGLYFENKDLTGERSEQVVLQNTTLQPGEEQVGLGRPENRACIIPGQGDGGLD